MPESLQEAIKPNREGKTISQTKRILEIEIKRIDDKHPDIPLIGIRAQTEIVVNSVCQMITSGGLYGIESDSDSFYLKEIENEELLSLCSILHNLGFSKRVITAAMKASGLPRLSLQEILSSR